MPRVIEVIEVDEKEGMGVAGDPIVLVRRYYTTDGVFLAEYDPRRYDKYGIYTPEEMTIGPSGVGKIGKK